MGRGAPWRSAALVPELANLGPVDEKILLVEDDRAIREITARGLEQEGFQVSTQSDGRQSLVMALREEFDLILLDVMLPTLDGFEVCRQVRTRSQVPIIMLTAKTDTVDVVLGLEAGADDYVTKPFEMPELIARVRATLRRAKDDTTKDKIKVGDLEVDIAGHRVLRGDETISLTATEFKVLLMLARHADQVLSREQLLEEVWEYDYRGDSRVVDMAIKRVREKVEDDPTKPTLIQTVRGVGYRLEGS